MQEVPISVSFLSWKIVYIQYEFTVSRPSINGALSFGLNIYNELTFLNSIH